MISGEEIPVAIKQNGVTASVAGRRYRDEVFIQLNGVVSAQHSLDVLGAPGDVVVMHDAFGLEASRPFLVIGHVVAVRQEHPSDAAHTIDLPSKWLGEPR